MELKKLREIRKQHKLSCEQIAKQIGITKPYYWMIENGQRRLSYDLACKISAIFGCTPDQIFLSTELTNGLQNDENNQINNVGGNHEKD